MIQLKTIVVIGQKVTKNGEAYFTIKDEIEKQVNPVLAKMGTSVQKVDFNLVDNSTALVVITVDETESGKVKK